MRKIKILIPFFLLLFFTSCFDTIEEFTLNEDGSGSYAMKMDLFRMVEMIGDRAGKDGLSDNKDFEEVKDSSFLFKDYIAKANLLTAEEKDLFREGRFDMHMNMQKEQMYFNYSFPFKKSSDLVKIYNGSPKALEAIAQQLPKEEDEQKTSGLSLPKAGAGNASFKGGEFFDLTNEKGVFAKKARVEAMKKYLEEDSTFKMMLPMLGSAYAITIVHLPRPAKNVNHPYAKLSEDKRTVTLKFPISDYFERPEVMDFKIEY